MKRTDEAPRPAGQEEPARRHRDRDASATEAAHDPLHSDAGASKTRRKAEMHALQDLGESLVCLSPARLATLSLPERLADAISDARTITRWEARRRQMQYIGRLMRDVDVEPVRARVREWSSATTAEKARMSAVERWRERLLADHGSLEDLCAEVPQADRACLSGLVDRVHKERASNQPPHAHRELFRVLNSLLRTSA